MEPERIISGFNREDDESRALRPIHLTDFIGQERIKQTLSICIEAAKRRGSPVDHILLSGPPGLGKTTLAHIVKHEMEVGIRTTSGPVVERKDDLAALLTGLETSDVLFIDEIHRLNRVVEECLYPAMEDFFIDVMIGEGPHAKSIRLDLPPFTAVGATTRTGLLTGPLRDRFGIHLRVEFYSPDSAASAIWHMHGMFLMKMDLIVNYFEEPSAPSGSGARNAPICGSDVFAPGFDGWM